MLLLIVGPQYWGSRYHNGRTNRVNYRALLSRTRGIALSAALVGGSIAVVGATSPAGASTASRAVLHTVKYSVSCNTTLGAETLSGSIRLNAPASVAPGASFAATGVRITIVVPASLVNTALAAGISSFSGKLTLYNVKSSDAKPTPKNFAATPRTIPKTTLVSGKALTLSIPGPAKTFNPSPWTAGTAGTDTVTAGISTAKISAFNSSGTLITTITANCKAPTPAKLFAVTVT